MLPNGFERRLLYFIESRIFHFDLKGAAPRLTFIRDVMTLLRRLGATGVLLEWEDMFPYTGELGEIKNQFAYSLDEAKQILKWANENHLDIIPLVQTFGHLEWILKHQRYANYRQQERYPQVFLYKLTKVKT